MPSVRLVVIVCGQPASGKSWAVQELAARFAARGQHPVEIVDEPSLHLVRDAAYADVVSEKNTRGSLRSALERALSGQAPVVLLDTLNNIKGYRYELWCIARASGVRYCVVHVDTPVDTCRAWNARRSGDDRYSDAIFEDLACRFERPDARNRWDAPLFTVQPAGSAEQSSHDLDAVILACLGPAPVPSSPGLSPSPGGAAQPTPHGARQPGPPTGCDDGGEPGDTDLYPGGVALPTYVPPAKDLKPTLATSKPLLSNTNLLHDMDAAVQEVIDCVMECQAAAAGGPAGVVRLVLPPPPGSSQGDVEGGATRSQAPVPALQFEQPVSLAELRRHKRDFLRLATKVTFSRLTDPQGAKRMFVDYLIDHVTACGRPHKGYG